MDAALANRIAAVRVGTNRISQRLEYETANITRLTSKIQTLENEKRVLVKAVGLIDRCIQVISANGIGKIESIVTGGLRVVFGKESDLGFVVEKKETARGYSYRLLVREGELVGNAMDSFGGSVQNVVAFLLRVILIKRFKLAKLLVLDENFANVGNEKGYSYLRQTSQLLRDLCDKHGFTALAISHQPILTAEADHVYKLYKPTLKGSPKLRKVEGEELDALKTTIGAYGVADDEADNSEIA